MSEFGLPKCPNCKEGVLIPLSAGHGDLTSKAFAHWICLKCGFYLGTIGTKGYNIKDIHVGIIPEFLEMMKAVKNSQKKIFFHIE